MPWYTWLAWGCVALLFLSIAGLVLVLAGGRH